MQVPDALLVMFAGYAWTIKYLAESHHYPYSILQIGGDSTISAVITTGPRPIIKLERVAATHTKFLRRHKCDLL